MEPPNINFDSKRNKSLSKISYFKSDNGLVVQNEGQFYKNGRMHPSNTNWNRESDSVNDSLPDMKANRVFAETPQNLQKKITARTMQKTLLGQEEDGLTTLLNKIYLNSWCPYFYLTIAIIWILMILWVVIQGKTAIRSLAFKMFELFINLFIVIDIICKIFLLGFEAYFKRLSNILEFSIGVICVLIYFLYYLSTTFEKLDYNELLENIVFWWWWIWQVFRIVTLFYKQRRTRRTEADNVSFSKFHDEIDHDSFAVKPSENGEEEHKSKKTRNAKLPSRTSSLRNDNKISQSMLQ